MIYCVEDDSSIRELMVYTLKASGFEAIGFCDGKAFFKALEERLPRLIMLDIMLPETDGIEILRRLRSTKAYSEIPVIIASAKGSEYDKVLGLDTGADDYLAKPFGMMEMVSRIKAVLRRSAVKTEKKDILRVGEIALNTSEHTVTAAGEPIRLTLKEFELLQLLMDNIGKVYSRDRLLLEVWDAEYAGETRTVDVHIGTLRTKLGIYGEYIETVRGVGYRMESRL